MNCLVFFAKFSHSCPFRYYSIHFLIEGGFFNKMASLEDEVWSDIKIPAFDDAVEGQQLFGLCALIGRALNQKDKWNIITIFQGHPKQQSIMLRVIEKLATKEQKSTIYLSELSEKSQFNESICFVVGKRTIPLNILNGDKIINACIFVADHYSDHSNIGWATCVIQLKHCKDVQDLENLKRKCNMAYETLMNTNNKKSGLFKYEACRYFKTMCSLEPKRSPTYSDLSNWKRFKITSPKHIDSDRRCSDLIALPEQKVKFDNRQIIKDASYFVFDNFPIITSPIDWLPISCFVNNGAHITKHVSFYSYSGEKLWTIPVNLFPFTQIDPTARKPQPKSFRRIWKLFQISPNSKFDGQGYVVLFHDKSGNRIGWEWMSSKDEDCSYWINWDLSIAIEELPNYSHFVK